MSVDISADTRSTCCSLFSTRPTPRPNVTITVSGVSVDFGWYRYIAYATKSCEISQGLEMKNPSMRDYAAGRERSPTNFLYLFWLR